MTSKLISRSDIEHMLEALQCKKRGSGSRIWRWRTRWHRHRQTHHIAILGHHSLLHRHRRIRCQLIRNFPELLVLPCEDHLPLCTRRVEGLQQDICIIRHLTAISDREAQTYRTPPMFSGWSDKDDLIGETIRFPLRPAPFPTGSYFSVLTLHKLSEHLGGVPGDHVIAVAIQGQVVGCFRLSETIRRGWRCRDLLCRLIDV